MKLKSTAVIAALALSMNAYSQFFDTVPFIGAFPQTGSTKVAATGYNPDPTNTNADWTAGWSNFTPNTTVYPGDAGWTPTAAHPATNANKVSVSGDISVNTTWTKNNWYEVSGTVHILSGATLTIEPGTVVRGNVNNVFVLIVAKGGKLNAVGTLQQPIVMTSGRAAGSRVRGDWGGLLMIGNAHTNTQNGVRQYEALPSDPLALYGGGPNYNDADNSGALRYLRVEYAGYNFLPDQEINGITFAGVGFGTTADYLQVSYANDDSYEWFGGASNHKYLIALAGTDDDFDMDEGYNGKCQFLLGVRNPAVFETSPSGTSNGLEHDNNTGLGSAGQVTPGVNAPTPLTAPIISNMTLLGPIRAGENRNSLSTTARARFGRALELRTNVSTSVFNSLIGGYLEGFRMVHPNVSISPSVQDRAINDEMSMRRNVLASAITTDVLWSSTNPPTSTGPFTTALLATWWFSGPISFPNPGNDTANTIAKFQIVSPSYTGSASGALNQIDFSTVNYMLASTSPYVNAARFNHPKIPTTPQPSITVNPSALPIFNQVVGTPSAVQFVVVRASNLAGNINMTIGTNFQISFNRTTGWATNLTKNGPSANDTVFVRYNRSDAGSNSAVLNITSTQSADFTPLNITVNGSATSPASPVIGVDKSLLRFSTPSGVASAEQTINVFGRFVSSNITVAVSAPYEVSTTSGSGFGATASITAASTINTQLFVRYNPTAFGSNSASLSLVTAGVDSIKVALEGTATGGPSITASPSGYPQWQIDTQTTSLAYPITVSGTNLTGVLKVVRPNSRYKLSADSAFTSPVDSIEYTPVSGTVASTKLFIRFQPGTNVGASAGNVAVTSTGATSRTVAVSGLALAANARRITVNSAATSWTFETVFGTPSIVRSFRVSAARLTARLDITYSVEGFQVSLDNSTWSNSLQLDTTAGGNIAETTVFLRYNPTVIGASGAQQLTLASTSATSIVFTVSGSSTPSITVEPLSLPEFSTTVGTPSYTASVSVSGTRLLGDVVISIPTGAGFEVSQNATSGFSNQVSLPKTGSTLAATTLYFRYNPAAAGSANSSASFATQSGPSSIITLAGFAVDLPTPVLNLSTASLTFNTSVAGPSSAKSFTVQGTNLRDSLRINVGSDFELTPDSTNGPWLKSWTLPTSAVATPLTLYCRFNRSTDGTSNSNIAFTSTALTTQNIAVTGTRLVTSVREISNISNFVMYPNPAKDQLNVLFTAEQTANITMTIIDVTGKVIGTYTENAVTGNNRFELNTADLNNGIYFLNIQSLESTKTVRFSIAK